MVDRLWAPWRLDYVTSTNEARSCVFCLAADRRDEPLVIFRGQSCFVLLNLYPYNSGHLMVVPVRHVPSLAATTPDERNELIALTRLAEMALTEAYQPQGLNMGVNLGRSAGAGVVDHLHVHLVPRWTGDANFMSVVGDIRVLPETLEDSAGKLRPIFARIADGERQHA
jgi:ATP adenylyltransferase